MQECERESGAGTGTKTERRVKGRESLRAYEVVIKGGRKIREGGRRQRVPSNHSRNTQSPNETVASCGGPEPRDGGARNSIGNGSGEANKKRSARNPRNVIDTLCKKGETQAEGEKRVDKKVLVKEMSTQKSSE